MRRGLLWLILGLLLIPSFSLMLRPGIYTMHDPHLFRIFEYERCIKDGVLPCRWAPDSGKGYGEPLFNFYAQAPYWITAVFHLINFSLIDSIKAAFILSLVASAGTMYLYARRFWGSPGGLVSAVFYVYAPYRAVDVWVRGSLPEALAFVLYPLILYFLDLFFEKRNLRHLLYFSLSLALLINIHNLSFLMFAPFLGVYWIVQSWLRKQFSGFWPLTMAGIFALLLSAFYLLPVIFESSLVTLSETVQGYYDYHVHFTTLRELFISRYWGYGASLWAQKFLSVSIGQVHWILPAFLTMYIFLKRKLDSITIYYILFTILGVSALFLTHGKSSFIWNLIPAMKYIQFPWRFLTIAVFFLSLASGFFAKLFPKRLIPIILLLLLFTNYSFFRPDIWRNISDKEQYSGALWDEARSSSLTDFWPKTATLPTEFAVPEVRLLSGDVQVNRFGIYSQSAYLDITANSLSRITLPIVYFPGWRLSIDNRNRLLTPLADSGYITFSLPPGRHNVNLSFTNTWPRTAGNLISLFAILSVPLWFLKKKLG